MVVSVVRRGNSSQSETAARTSSASTSGVGPTQSLDAPQETGSSRSNNHTRLRSEESLPASGRMKLMCLLIGNELRANGHGAGPLTIRGHPSPRHRGGPPRPVHHPCQAAPVSARPAHHPSPPRPTHLPLPPPPTATRAVGSGGASQTPAVLASFPPRPHRFQAQSRLARALSLEDHTASMLTLAVAVPFAFVAILTPDS